jgi:hypothetical protein
MVPQLLTGFVVAPLATVLGWFLNNWTQRARQLPIIDADLYLHPRGAPAMPVSVTNRGETALNVRRVEILRPKGARIAWDTQGLFGMTPPFPNEAGAAVLDLHDHCVFAGSRDTLPFFFVPPQGWREGKVELRLEIGFREPRRVKIKKYHLVRTLTGALREESASAGAPKTRSLAHLVEHAVTLAIDARVAVGDPATAK